MSKRCVLFPTGGLYSSNKSIGFSSCGESYQSGFSLLSLLGLKPRKKLGRPRGSRDSYKRHRIY